MRHLAPLTTRGRGPWARCALVLALVAAAFPPGCDGGSDETAALGVGQVEVTLAGQVRSIETDLPISGIVVELVRDEPGHTGLDAVTVAEIARTDAQGAFGPSPPLVIEPEDYRYALRLKDSEAKARYQPNAATTVFALVASDLRFDNLVMTPNDQRARLVVSGVVLDARTDAPLPGVKVALLRDGQGTPVHETVSGANGSYAFERVLVDTLRVEFDGSTVITPGAPGGYIREYAPAVLPSEGAEFSLGQTRLVPQSEREDLTILLDWRYETPDVAPFDFIHNLDLVVSVTDPSVDVNHLHGLQVDLSTLVPAAGAPVSAAPGEATDAGVDDNPLRHLGDEVPIRGSDLSIAPSSGFGAGTGYWPSFLGGTDALRRSVGDVFQEPPPPPEPPVPGEARTEERRCMEAPGRTCVVGVRADAADVLLELQRRSDTGEGPESVVFRQINPFNGFPSKLAYHYVDTGGVSRYPVGVAVASVVARADRTLDGPAGSPDMREIDADVHRSEAVLKVYQGARFVGRFDIGETVVPPGEDTKSTWTPMVVEYGFTDANPIRPDQLYFRVVPFTAIKQTVQRREWAYTDRSAAEQGLVGARASVDYDGTLFLAGRMAWADAPAGADAEFFVLGPDPSGVRMRWHPIGNRCWPIYALGIFNGAVAASFGYPPAQAMPPPATACDWVDDPALNGVDVFGPLTGSDVGNLKACPPAAAMAPVVGDFLLATSEGLRSGLNCEDPERPFLAGAPSADLRTVGQHRFGAGTRLLLGGVGTGIWSTALPDTDANPPTVVAWAAGAPGLEAAVAEGRGPPADATITALRSVNDTLYVGTLDHGLFAVWRDDGAATPETRDVWVSLNEGSGVFSDGGGLPMGAQVRQIELSGERVLIASDRGLWIYTWDAALQRLTFTQAQPPLAIEHMAVYGSTIYLFTDLGAVEYR